MVCHWHSVSRFIEIWTPDNTFSHRCQVFLEPLSWVSRTVDICFLHRLQELPLYWTDWLQIKCISYPASVLRNQQNTKFAVVQVNDGSSLQGLQVIVNKDAQGYDNVSEGRVSTGAAVHVSGVLLQSPGGKQSVSPYVKPFELIFMVVDQIPKA